MINSVLKALDVLELFSREEPTLTLGDISKRLDFPKSTAHNLLKTLASRGYVQQIDNGVYSLGTSIIPLTQNIRVNVDLRDRAAPILRELSDTCRESVYLTILDGDAGLYIYAVELPGRLLARTAVGDRGHLHCTAVGKAMLSNLPATQLSEIFGRIDLPQFTPNTIVDLAGLTEELQITSERGYAADCAEHENGVFCIAAPIFDRRGKVIAACSISGSDPEIVGERENDLSNRVMYAAQEISRLMGLVPNRVSFLTSAPDRPVPAYQ